MSSITNRFPATLASVTTVLLLTTFFWATGALFPTELPQYATSSRQVTGMVLMLIVLPAYLVAASFAIQRRSLGLVEQLRPEGKKRTPVDKKIISKSESAAYFPAFSA